MTRDPVTVSPEATLADATEAMRAGGFRRLPVMSDGRLVGIVTDHDIFRNTHDARQSKVTDFFTRPALTVNPSTPLEEAARVLIQRKIGGLPVVEDGKLVGIITTTDVIDALLDVMGVFDEHTCRIDLAFENGNGDLSGATRVLHDAGAEVLGVGSFRQKWRKAPVFYLRARCPEVGRATQALKERGYQVLAVHTGPEGIRA